MWHFSRGLGGTLFACSSSMPPSLSSSRWTTSQGWRFFIFLFSFSCKCPFPFRWVQDPEQQKKKKENAILDVRIFLILNPSWSHPITMSSKSLRVVTIFHVNSYNSSWSKTIKPNHNVLKVSASGDGRSERALSNGEGRNAQVGVSFYTY